MLPIWFVFKQKTLQLFRDKFGLFWTIIFPVLLLAILILIFGNITGEDATFSPRVSLIVEDEGAQGEILKNEMQRVSEEDGGIELVSIGVKGLDEEIEKLKDGQYHIVFRVPEGFSEAMGKNIFAQQRGITDTDPAVIEIYWEATSEMSRIVGEILHREVIEGIMQREIALGTGLMRAEDIIETSENYVSSADDRVTFSYVDFILPGVVLMGFLSVGLNSLTEGLVFDRDRKILRRFFVTPLTPGKYTAGFLLHILLVAVLQVIVLNLVGTRVFGSGINLFGGESLFFLLYSLAVMLSLGLLLSSVARDANAASTLTNVFFYPIMFLGGLFFPVEGVPGFLQIIVDLNPLTYLSNGLRESLGVYPSPTADYLNLLVPALWLVVSLIVGLKKFRWEPS